MGAGIRCSQAPELLERNPESFGCGTTEVLSYQLIRAPGRTPFLCTSGRNGSEGVALIDSKLAYKFSALWRHQLRDFVINWRHAPRAPVSDGGRCPRPARPIWRS